MKRIRLAAPLIAATLVIHGLVWVPIAAADVPVAVDDAYVVQKDSVANNLRVLDNDTVAVAADITTITTPGHGTAVAVASNRRIAYSPDAGYSGPDTFQYTVTDPVDGDSTATVTIDVNAPPVAVADPSTPGCWYGPSQTFALPEDKLSPYETTFSCNLLSNDTDSDGTVVNWELVTGPAHGIVTNDLPLAVPGFSSDFSYTPDADVFTLPGDQQGGSWLSDSFTYRAIDNDGGVSAPVSVTFWIAPVNDAPGFSAGASPIHADEGVPYSATWATSVSPGPNEGYQSVHFELAGDPGNPSDLFSTPPSIDASGTLSFTGALGHAGTATFEVVAKDDGGLEDYGGGSDQPTPHDTSAPATLTITIDDVNHAPVAVDDTDTTSQDSAGVLTEVTANDTDADGDPLTVTGRTDGTKGTTSIGLDGTSVLYVPNAGQTGADSYTYTVSDGQGGTDVGTVNITILAGNAAPVATDDVATLAEDDPATPVDVLANDTDSDNDTLHVTGVTQGGKGSVVITGLGNGVDYTPNADANGSDSFTYTIDDGHGGTDTATVDVTITAVNDPPVAADDTTTVTEDQASASTVTVLANDTDVENDALTVTGKTNGAKGIVTISAGGGSVTYKPNTNAFGSDSFTYTVSDGHGGTDTATVNVTITAVNDRPNAVNDPGPYTVYLRSLPRAIPVLANDTSLPDGPETLTIISVTQGSHGKVAITGGGTGVTYTSSGSTLGLDVFTYTISDGHGGTDSATVQVKVVADTTKPVATITSIAKASVVGSPTRVRLTVNWTLTDTGSGLKSQVLQRRVDSGSWVTMTLSSSTVRTFTTYVPKGHTYTFRVRGTDRYGNIGAYASRSIKV